MLRAFRGAMACLVAFGGCGAMQAYGDDGFVVDGVRYMLRNVDGVTQAAVSMTVKERAFGYQYPLDEDGKLTIPEEITQSDRTYPVTMIDNGIVGQKELKTLVLPSSIVTVSAGIIDCPALETLDMGGANKLVNHSVSNLPALEELKFTDNALVIVGENCMSGLGLTEWTPPANLASDGGFVYNNWPRLARLDFKNNGVNGYAEWNDLANLEELVLPEGMSPGFQGMSFRGTSKLRKLTLPKDILYVDCIGEDLSYLFLDSFDDLSAVEEIYCQSIEPPIFGYTVYADPDNYNFKGGPVGCGTADYDNCKVYVPKGTAQAYRTNLSWSKFANIVEIDFAGIEGVEAGAVGNVNGDFTVSAGTVRTASGAVPEVFTLTGVKTSADNLPAGNYIVRSGSAVAKITIR